MMLKKLLLFFGLLQAVIGQDRRIYIDTVSCVDPTIFAAIRESYQSAIIRAGLAIDALRPWARGGAPINTFDGRIRAVFDLLFGAGGTRVKVNYVFGHLDRLLEIRYMNDLMTGGDWTSGPTKRTMNDIEIHCNADYVIEHPNSKEPNINHWDTVQKKKVPDTHGVLELKYRFTKPAFAATSVIEPASGKNWNSDAPEVIAWNPWKLFTTVYLDGFPGTDRVFGGIKINQATVEAAANARMRRWFVSNAPEWLGSWAWTPIDLLDRLEGTMLHELTHTTAGRRTEDPEGSNSYGWRNCVRIQSHQNADSIAMFALAVELINFYHYDVNEAGVLTRIDD